MNKKNQKINIEIPLDVWDDFEDVFIIEKRQDPQRKLLKKDFLVMIVKKGIENWINSIYRFAG